MSNLRINCPRCHASLHVNRHQEQSGHLGCTHCGQLIRLAPSRPQASPTMSTPMVAPAFQQGAYWNQSPQSRKQSNTALWAVAIASLGLFLTVLTLCVTFLLWQQRSPAIPSDQVSIQKTEQFLPPGEEPPAAKQPVPPPAEVATKEPEVEPQVPEVSPEAENPLGKKRRETAQAPPRAEQPPLETPPPKRPQPFAANRPTKAPPPPLEPIPGPPVERPEPSMKIN